MARGLLGVLILLTLVLGGCGEEGVDHPVSGTSPPDHEASRADVVGKSFVATSYAVSGASRPTAPGSRFSLDFTKDRVAFGTGCNSGGGSFTLRHGILRVHGVVQTMMACPGERGRQEHVLIDLLEGGSRAAMAGSRLVLTGHGTVIRFLPVGGATVPKGFETPQ